jgi:hypothetical protein
MHSAWLWVFVVVGLPLFLVAGATHDWPLFWASLAVGGTAGGILAARGAGTL